mmetsp:Transcript_77573/g.222157  ORF Transcript_77573/g.222157 Transcript_77573/m.222157 type:complete len:490 (-) Transcript_77573:515-1984(-)
MAWKERRWRSHLVAPFVWSGLCLTLLLGGHGPSILTFAGHRFSFWWTPAERATFALYAVSERRGEEAVDQDLVREAEQALQMVREQLVPTGFFGLSSFLPMDREKLVDSLVIAACAGARGLVLLEDMLVSSLPSLDSEKFAALATSIAKAQINYKVVWLMLQEAFTESCASGKYFSTHQLTEIAWAFALTGEGTSAMWSALQRGMASAGQLSDQERRVFGWACATAGQQGNAELQQLLGDEASGQADPSMSQRICTSLQRLADEGTVTSYTSEELPLRNLRPAEAYSSDQILVLAVPNVISDFDAEVLIGFADSGGLWRGSEKLEMEGSIGRRTSASAQLSHVRYLFAGPVMKIRSWVSSTLGVPDSHIEALQMVRYFKGQQYTRHVDWCPAGDPELWVSGQRVATVLLYLSTVPEDCGGETVFERLGVSVKPELGKAVIWSNVDRTGKPDPLTMHEAMPIECDEVVKYTMNVWVREQPQPDRSWLGWR